jgi:hypothetical protein
MFRFTSVRAPVALVGAALLGLLISATTAQAGLITLGLTPSAAELPVNGSFNVVVSGNVEQKILGFGFDLLFDDSKLELKSVQVGSSFLPLPASDGDKLAGMAFPKEVLGSNVTFATATFAAKTAGVAAISLGVTLGDYTEGFPESGGLRYSQFTIPQTQVNVVAASTGGGDDNGGGNPPPAVPEPATMLIVGLSGLAIAIRRHR